MKQMKTLTVNGVTYAVYDPTAPRIDDGAVGDAPWSAKKIVDTLCPAFQESGAIVTCRPVAGYPLEVAAADTVTRCGMNLLPYPYSQGSRTVHGVTFTVGDDGTVTVSGTAAEDAVFTLLNSNLGYPYSEAAGVGFSGCPAGGSTSTYYMENAWCGLQDAGNGCQLHPNVAGSVHKQYWCSHLYIVIKKGYTADNLVFKPCLYYGCEKKEYVPYQGKETFAPGETVPALPGVNTIIAASGQLTVTGRGYPWQ